MKTSLQFRNFDGLDHIKLFTEESIYQSLDKFEAWRDFDIHMVISTVKARSSSHRPIFQCELLLTGKGIAKPIIVKKISSDFYHSVRTCLHVAEKKLRRSSKIRVTNRRKIVQIPNVEVAA